MNLEKILEPGEYRDNCYQAHPVVLDEVHAVTPAAQEAYDVVVQVLVHRDPGICLIADFRFGKTRAQSIIVDSLRGTFPNIPVWKIIAKSHGTPSEKNFFTDILIDYRSGFAGSGSGTAMERRWRVLNIILTHARQLKSNCYLLLVDEGQNWKEAEYDYFRDLTNDCVANGVRILTVIFGHPKIQEVRQNLLNRKRTDLVGRFLLSPRIFRGIQGEAELRNVLEAYDDPAKLQYPIGSGVSYTQFFRPERWGKGWRLASEAGEMLRAFRRVALCDADVAELGMNWVSGAIRSYYFSPESDNSWDAAIAASGFESSL